MNIFKSILIVVFAIIVALSISEMTKHYIYKGKNISNCKNINSIIDKDCEELFWKDRDLFISKSFIDSNGHYIVVYTGYITLDHGIFYNYIVNINKDYYYVPIWNPICDSIEKKVEYLRNKK